MHQRCGMCEWTSSAPTATCLPSPCRYEYCSMSVWNDKRLLARVDDVPKVWTHEDIMDLITLGGRNVHPDHLKGQPGIRVQKPGIRCDYFQEGHK